jgi:hypothetical protein
MATAKDEIMAKTGPEDNLVVQRLSTNTSQQYTAGPDWVIARGNVLPRERLDFKDDADAERLALQVQGTGPEATILEDLARSRNVCAKSAFNLEVRGHMCGRMRAHVPILGRVNIAVSFRSCLAT